MTKQKQLRPMEVRTVRASQFRASTTNNNQMHVSGYVNKTGQPSDPIPNMGEVPTDSDIPGNDPDSFIEIMQPGVFKNALQQADFVDFLYEHEPKDYLASTKDGSMSLAEDSTGLKMSATITPTSWGKDAFTLIKSGAIAGMSFGFIVLDDDWDLSGAIPVRTVTQIQLFEVSAVRFPAYPSSTIEARRKYMKRLNAKLEKRGFTMPRIYIPNKGSETKMYSSKITKRANGGTSIANGADANTIAAALGQVQNSIDNLTNAVQTNSEVQSNIADQIMQAANSERAKKTKHAKVSTDAKKRAAKTAAKKRETKDDGTNSATASDVASDESASDEATDEDDLDTDSKKSKSSMGSMKVASKKPANKKTSGKAKSSSSDGSTVDTDAKKTKAKTDTKKPAKRSKVADIMATLNDMEKH